MRNSPKPISTTPARSLAPHQLRIVFDSSLLGKMSAVERTKAIACLANLLMQAAGAATGERSDDER